MYTNKRMVRLKAPSRRENGSIMLLVLIMLVLFVLIMAASIRFISRQSNQTVLQEQEEQAFAIAEAGINYAVWLVGTSGGFTPIVLVENLPNAVAERTRNHEVINDTGEVIGSFDLDFLSATASSLTVRATGRDLVHPELCQVIEATLQSINAAYRITAWDHLAGYPCTTSTPPPSDIPTTLPTTTP